MAKGTMSSYYDIICFNRHEAPSWGIITRLVNGATELYPGYPATNSGETNAEDVCHPDGNDDVTLGLCITCEGLSKADAATVLTVDAAYPDNEPIEIARTGSGLICAAFIDDDEGALVVNTALYSTGADNDGFLEKLDTIDVDTAFSEAGLQAQFDILTNAPRRYVGRAYEHIADQGSTDTPEKVLLV